MRVLARRSTLGFVPADTAAEAEFKRVPIGRVAYVEIVTARNPRQHRMLFALLKMLVNADAFPTIDAALIAVKFATGMIESIVMSKTETKMVPRSISFANMPQSDFQGWFDAALKAVSERWLPGVTDKELRDEIEEMLG
jgi:hypothetical protein